MRGALVLAPIVALLLLAVMLLGGEDLPPGKYRKPASKKRLAQWERHYATKKGLVPPPPAPHRSKEPAVDFSGVFRFGKYNYDLVIEQTGDEVTFRSGGVDHQDIGGAFETHGAGVVVDGVIRARWWCLDLSRNYANTGGAEIWFWKGDTNRVYVRYYHDADERIEEGYGVRLGAYRNERQHYRIRIKHPVKKYPGGLTLRGSVRERDGRPLRDAIVMLRHEEHTAVRTDAEGRFSLRVKKLPTVQMVAAAAPGYRARVEAILKHEVRELHFVLDRVPHDDDPRYEFLDPTRSTRAKIWNCGNCHRTAHTEWQESRHALTAKNVITKAVYERDFVPALESGEATGDKGLCAACHAPQAALDGAVAALPDVRGVALHGNHCDFCHKVHHVDDLDAPGVRGSLGMGRPSPDDERIPGPIKRIYGTLADADYLFMGPVFNPLFSTGALCAGCHQYTTDRGIPALDTYGEWLSWSATQDEHRSCQACHMTTGTSIENGKPAKRICINALRRPEEQIHDHSFRGRELALEAVQVDVTARIADGRVHVKTTVRSIDVGHKVPTGSSDKHLLLVVMAMDESGRTLVRTSGPRVPRHAGSLAGQPGREFAQVLADKAGRTHVPFWRAVRMVEDTRLAPGVPVLVEHAFNAPKKGAARILVKLIHRLRFAAHDVARDIVGGPGVRPLDMLIAERRLEAEAH